MREESLLGELGLILELDPVPCLVVLHSVLQDHKFKHLLGFRVKEFTLEDEGIDMGVKGMDTLTRELADIREEFILEVPVVVFSLDHCADGV